MSEDPNSIISVLKVGQFRSLWIGQIFSQIATSSLIFVLGILVFKNTGSNTAVSLLFLVYGVPAVLFGMVAGTIVDKLEKRSVLLTCDLLRAVLVLAFAIFSRNMAVIYFFTFVNAILTQFYIPSAAPTIPYLVGKGAIVSANSLFSLTYFSSLAIGSVFAGPMLKAFGPFWVFLILSVFFLTASFFESRIPRILGKGLARPFSFSDAGYYVDRVGVNLKEGLVYLKRSPVISDALLLLLGTQVMLAVLGTLAPGFAVRVLEIPVNDASLYIMGPAVLGIMLGALWIGNVGYKIAIWTLIRTGLIAAGIILIIVSVTVRLSRLPGIELFFTRSLVLPVEFLLFFLLGVANSLLDVPANSMLQEHSEGEMRGRIYGLLTSAVGGVGILPVVIGGVLADTIGVGKVIFFLGVVVLGYGILRMKYSTTR